MGNGRPPTCPGETQFGQAAAVLPERHCASNIQSNPKLICHHCRKWGGACQSRSLSQHFFPGVAVLQPIPGNLWSIQTAQMLTTALRASDIRPAHSLPDANCRLSSPSRAPESGRDGERRQWMLQSLSLLPLELQWWAWEGAPPSGSTAGDGREAGRLHWPGGPRNAPVLCNSEGESDAPSPLKKKASPRIWATASK